MSAINTDTDLYQTLGLATKTEQQSDDQLQLEDFLTLMVTELTHQDPFKPMDNTELATQISQFATVSGIEELNDSFAGLSGNLISDQSIQAASLVGHDVLVPVNGGYLEEGGSIDGVIGLNSSASDVTVNVYDGSGALIKEMGLGTREKGEHSFSWNGSADDGEPVESGYYTVAVHAQVDGETIAPYLLTQARVSSVSIGSGGQGLQLNLKNLGPISFNDVAEIR